MKKNLLLMTAAVIAALSSCSSEDVEEMVNTDNPIKFIASVNNGRGLNETTTPNLDYFYVTGVDHESNQVFFSNVLFKREGDEYVSNPPYQWSNRMNPTFYCFGYNTGNSNTPPMAVDQKYEAFANDSPYGEVTLDEFQQTMNNVSPAPLIKDQIDLVAAVGIPSMQAMGNSVSLNFTHIFSQIQVKALCSSEVHTVQVKAMKFGNIQNKANFQFQGSGGAFEWNDYRSVNSGGLSTTYEIEFPYVITLPKSGAADLSQIKTIGYATLLPQTLTTFNSASQCFVRNEAAIAAGKSLASCQYMALLIKITTNETGAIKFPLDPNHMDNDGFGWTFIPFHYQSSTQTYAQWFMNNRYIYTLDFVRGGGYDEEGDEILTEDIRFTASVSEWSSNSISRPEKKPAAE